MGKLVLMTTWAKAHFEIPPCKASLRLYAKTKQTYPPAIRQGRRWVIDEDAEFVGVVDEITIPSNVPESVRILMERSINGSKT